VLSDLELIIDCISSRSSFESSSDSWREGTRSSVDSKLSFPKGPISGASIDPPISARNYLYISKILVKSQYIFLL